MPVFKLTTSSDRTESKKEVTRWEWRGEITEKTHEALIERLKRLFNKKAGQFFVSWHDGTDYCTIRDYHDLQEAVNFFEGSTEEAVRLFVSPDKHDHRTIFGQSPPEEEPPKKVEPQPAIAEESDSDSSDEKETEESVTKPVPKPEPVPQQPTAPVPTQPTQPQVWPNQPQYIPIPVHYPCAHYYPQGPHMVPPNQQVQNVTTGVTEPVKPEPTTIDEDNKATESAKTSVQTQEQPVENPEKPKKVKHKYVKVAMITLRQMGFTQDEKELKKLIKEHHGNLNVIIDKLNAQTV